MCALVFLEHQKNEGVCALVYPYGVRMITLSQSPSNHGATGTRAGPYAMQVKGAISVSHQYL